MTESSYWQRVSDQAAQDSVDTSIADNAAGLVLMVTTEAQRCTPWALEVERRWAHQGAVSDFKRAAKSLRSLTVIDGGGRKVKGTTAFSRPRVSSSTGDGSRQMRWIFDCTFTELTEIGDDLKGQMDRLGISRAQIEAMKLAMLAHPDCVTAGAAWFAAGHSLDEINLSA